MILQYRAKTNNSSLFWFNQCENQVQMLSSSVVATYEARLLIHVKFRRVYRELCQNSISNEIYYEQFWDTCKNPGRNLHHNLNSFLRNENSIFVPVRLIACILFVPRSTRHFDKIIYSHQETIWHSGFRSRRNFCKWLVVAWSREAQMMFSSRLSLGNVQKRDFHRGIEKKRSRKSRFLSGAPSEKYYHLIQRQ